MSASARISGAWKTGNLYQRVGGVWKQLTISARVAGVWKSVAGASPLAAAVDHSSISQTWTHNGDPGPDLVTTFTQATVTPSGGTGTYTYAWSRISGTTAITADNPTGAATTFTGYPLSYPNVYPAIFQCLVTDSAGATATALVAVEFDPG